MASLSVSSSSTIIDSRAPPLPSRQASSPSCISLPTLPPQPLQSQTRAAKATAYCRKIVRNVLTRAADVEVVATTQVEAPAANTEAASTELPDIVKTVQEAWEKVEDKYAVSSLAVSGFVALWGTAGVISAIDRLQMASLQSSGMLTKEQMVYLFDRFDYLTSQSDVKKRISDAVEDKQEAVAVTTAIQEEIFLEMGIDPGFGIGCLGKLNSAFENDKELMIGFYKFLAKEEMACEEAELGPDCFQQKMEAQQQLHEQQLEMLKYMRKFPLDDQSAILKKLQKQLENADFEPEASLLSGEQLEEAGRRRVSPVFGSR